MNRLHWHLTDDEGWRLPSRAFHELADIGGTREPQRPPAAAIRRRARGPVRQLQRRRDRGRSWPTRQRLGIDGDARDRHARPRRPRFSPSVPGLRDPDEPADSYRSIQGYPEQRAEPGAASAPTRWWRRCCAEAAALFPGAPIHVGGDEVDERSWSASPAAQALAAARGAERHAAELQAHFLRRRAGHGRAALGRDMGGLGRGGRRRRRRSGGHAALRLALRGKTAELIGRGLRRRRDAGPGLLPRHGRGRRLGRRPAPPGPASSSPETAYRVRADGRACRTGRGGSSACRPASGPNTSTPSRGSTPSSFPRLAAVAEAAWTPRRGEGLAALRGPVAAGADAMKRVAIGGLHTECSSYSPLQQTAADFTRTEGAALVAMVRVDFAALGIAPVPLFHDRSVPGGPVAAATFAAQMDELLAGCGGAAARRRASADARRDVRAGRRGPGGRR